MKVTIEKLKAISCKKEFEALVSDECSFQEIVDLVRNEIKPLEIKMCSVDDLYKAIVVLKNHWDTFQNDIYFRSESARYIFALTHMDGEKRNQIIGLTSDLYDDEQRAKIWYRNIMKKIHPDLNPENSQAAKEAVQILDILYGRVLKCFQEGDE